MIQNIATLMIQNIATLMIQNIATLMIQNITTLMIQNIATLMIQNIATLMKIMLNQKSIQAISSIVPRTGNAGMQDQTDRYARKHGKHRPTCKPYW
jgi:hypothetical protein